MNKIKRKKNKGKTDRLLATKLMFTDLSSCLRSPAAQALILGMFVLWSFWWGYICTEMSDSSSSCLFLYIGPLIGLGFLHQVRLANEARGYINLCPLELGL